MPRQRLPRARRPLAEFLHDEATGGIVLLGATVLALAWANIGPESYKDLWSTAFGSDSVLHLRLDLHAWVNDGLMALFFFVVGLEIKRELVVGELATRRAAAMPAMAAAGGMAVPALIYFSLNRNGLAADGWAIPMATDIAFVVGALSLLRSKAPPGLRLFLLAVAIVDDLGAIIVIALFYSSGVDLAWLGAAVAVVAGVLVMRRAGANRPFMYIVPAIALWAFIHESGVHATIAGVVMGVITPTGLVKGRPVLTDLERRLHPLSAFAVVPIFALANAGVRIDGDTIESAVASTVSWGVLAGLIVGKTVGIAGVALGAQRLGLAQLPVGVRTVHVIGGAALAGIGFTVALFIAELSFRDTPLLAEAKLAILATSAVAAAVGSLILATAHRRTGRI